MQSSNDAEVPVVETTSLFQAAMRQKITPYLPPPVVRTFNKIDPLLEPYVGAEPSMTILATICLGMLLWQLFIRTTTGAGGRGKAVQDDDEDADLLQQDSRYFDATVLFCGPSLAGKTTIWRYLASPGTKKRINTTVKSIKPNTSFVEDGDKTWRYLDTPGHWGASKLLSTIPLNSVRKVILVLDATQPVNKATDYLYSICKQRNNNGTKLLVACHKAKAPKAKNIRRLKLQLRSELERLEKLKLNYSGAENDQYTDWERVLETIEFCASSCEDPTRMEGIQHFCKA